MKRPLVSLLLVLVVLPAMPSARALDLCTQRLLVLSAFPGEIDRLLTTAQLDLGDTVVLDGRSYFVGTLRGRDVVLTLTGIGLVNAERTAEAALEHFVCGGEPSIKGIVFSGVAGSRFRIGDVTVPSRWTQDGTTWFEVDPGMLAIADQISADAADDLVREVPVGDVACAGTDPGLIRPVTLEEQPRIIIGGDGSSSDPFGGRALPCIPFGGDIFGCEACRTAHQTPDLVRFVTGAVPFIDPSFFLDYFESPPATEPGVDAQDMETAAVARVATENATPFIAFRAASDGDGDPLMLPTVPGFPFTQFFVYRQIAADNAAAVTLAFLEAWSF